MPIAINGTGTITGISAGGLPDACVTAADLAPNLSRFLLSANQSVLTTVQIINTAGWVDVSNITVTVTPASSASRFMIMTDIKATTQNNGTFRLVRTVSSVDTPIYIGTSPAGAGLQSGGGDIYGGTYSGNNTGNFHFIDSPSTTSNVTYKVQAQGITPATYPLYINATNYDGDASWRFRGASSIIVLEFAS